MVDVIEKKEARKVPSHEAIERAWASNDKLVFDDRSGHSKVLMNYSEAALKESLDFTKSIHNEYLKREQQSAENNRFTMNYLYTIHPEEAIGLAVALREILEEYKKKNKK